MQCSKTRFLTSLGMTMMPDESVNHSDNNNNIIVLAISVYSLSISQPPVVIASYTDINLNKMIRL